MFYWLVGAPQMALLGRETWDSPQALSFPASHQSAMKYLPNPATCPALGLQRRLGQQPLLPAQDNLLLVSGLLPPKPPVHSAARGRWPQKRGPHCSMTPLKNAPSPLTLQVRCLPPLALCTWPSHQCLELTLKPPLSLCRRMLSPSPSHSTPEPAVFTLTEPQSVPTVTLGHPPSALLACLNRPLYAPRCSGVGWDPVSGTSLAQREQSTNNNQSWREEPMGIYQMQC